MTKFSTRMEFLQNKSRTFQAIFLNTKNTIIVAIVIACSFVSCNKLDSFGLQVQPEQDLLGVNQTDSTTLLTYSVKEDSLPADEISGPNMIGSCNDPFFGKTNASIYTHIRLDQSFDFRPNGSGSLDSLIVDSVILYLALEGYYGSLGPQTFEVYQLAEDLWIDSTYYTNSTLSTNLIDLVSSGNGVINPNPLVPGYVDGELVDDAIIRIPLSINDFAWPIINESGNTSLDGNDGTGEFIEWFKGLLITTNNTSPGTNEGCIFYTDLLSSNSKISLFYRDTSGTAADHDTIQFDFNLNANCARFHNIAMDNGNSPLGDQLLDSTLGQEIFFVQSLGGAKGKIHFPFLDYINDSSYIINKAELILPFQFYYLDNYLPSSVLYLTSENENGQDAFLPDFYESDHGGVADLNNHYYKFNITRYINDIVSGNALNLPLTVITSGSGITANRVILNGNNTSKKDKPRLILTYSNY